MNMIEFELKQFFLAHSSFTREVKVGVEGPKVQANNTGDCIPPTGLDPGRENLDFQKYPV